MPVNPKQLKIKDFAYFLPDDQIAKYPLTDRAASKLLLYKKGVIADHAFWEIPELLPSKTLLIFNNTKVVQARLYFQRPTGSTIEVFCLEPVSPSVEMQQAMQQTGGCTWKCLVGNAKRWKEDLLELGFETETGIAKLRAEKVEKLSDSYLIKFSWEPQALTFAEILEKAGNLPLPPYLNRDATDTDKQTYQTVYAQKEGAVAAPTAGLHFTGAIIEQLRQTGTKTVEVTLHVGAGTFRPVKAEAMAEHTMHGEEIYVSVGAIKALLEQLGESIIPVGTTSLRTLESLYWLGMKLKTSENFTSGLEPLHVDQWLPYQDKTEISAQEALETLLLYLDKTQQDHIRATTQLLIAPGYQFKLTTGLITNFHQPESTLLLLVSALIGENWRQMYDHALQNNYRFLSYGDSSLLLP